MLVSASRLLINVKRIEVRRARVRRGRQVTPEDDAATVIAEGVSKGQDRMSRVPEENAEVASANGETGVGRKKKE